MKLLPAAVVLLAAALAAGCATGRRFWAVEPGVSQVVRVTSGDRIFFNLEETSGFRWDFKCDDDDVSVSLERDREKVGETRTVHVEIRIHRGYDGPSAVTFVKHAQNGAPTADGRFTVTLFKRTGDTAFWK